ncbi:MAG: GNAT family N-acetyltransferase [Cyanobacteria bacterium P01_H01_bin.153]
MVDPDIRLRSATPQDEKEIYRLLCLPEVFEYLADGKEPSPSVASAWVKSTAADFANYGGGLWVLTDKSDLCMGGLVRLAGDDNGELELIYLLHPSLWGLGLATRMSHTVMKQAFAMGMVSTIWAGADAPNQASLAVMKRLGMQFRREVQYPLGPGLEYRMPVAGFDPARIEPLPLA